MAFKDYINQKEKEKQETSFGQYARQKAGGAEEKPAASASAGSSLLQQLARQAVAAMTNPLQTIQSAALAPARAMNTVSQAAGNIARAGGSVAGALGANGQANNQVAAQMRALSPTMRAQEAARQQAEQAVVNNAALRYSLQQASRGAEAQALGVAASMANMGKGQFEQTARGNLAPYSGMLGPGASRATQGLTQQARQLIGLEQRYTGNAQPYRTRLLDAADAALQQRAGELAKYASSDDYAAAQRAEAERLSNNFGPFMDKSGNLVDAGAAADEAMRRYYEELPFASNFRARQENPYGSGLSDAERADIMFNGTPDEIQALRRTEAMTDDERAIATYLKNTQGTGALNEYLKAIEGELDARVMNQIETGARRWGQNSPVAASIASVGMNLANSINAGRYVAGRTLDALGKTSARYFEATNGIPFTGNTSPQALVQYFRNNLSYDENNRAFQSGAARDAILEGASANMSPLGKFVYQTGMSGVLYSTTNMLAFGGAGEVMMGLGAMADTVRATKLRGGDDMQAMGMGIVAGAAEVITENLGFERVRGLFGASRDKIVAQLLTSGLSEFGEEAASEIANIMADIFVMGDKGEFAEKRQAYLRQGRSEGEATLDAIMDAAGQVGLAGLGGALGGLVMGGGSAATGQLARLFDTTAQGVAMQQMEKLGRAYDGRAREVFLNSWDGQTTPAEYKTAFDALYDSGRLGVSLEQTQETAGEALRGMEPARQYQIWQAGENAAQAEKREYTDPISGEDFTSEMPARRTSSAADAAHSPKGEGKTGAKPNENAAGRESTVTRDAEIEAMPDVSGRTDAERFNPATVKGGVVKNYTARRLNYRQGVNIRALDRLGKRLGIEFEIVDSIKAGKGQANASYAGGRRFLVALNATENAYLQAGAHELVHYVRNYDADGYRAMERIVVDALGQDATFDMEAQISARQEEYANAGQQLTREQALEEIVAEAVPTVFSDQKVIEQLVMEDRTLAEKIGDWLHKFIEKVTKALRESVADYAVSQGREEIAALYNQAEALREIAKAFDSALERAGENAAARETEQEQSQSVEAEEEMPAAASMKSAQLELIQRTNPMTDEYHTGIRKESDIKTAEEALGTRNDDEWYVYPDWKWEDGQRALQSGKVTLYSSHPIEEGAFVSPSRMMASDYAGGGKVHSKRVSVDDVAWINADEGQYAPVSDQPGVRFSMKSSADVKDTIEQNADNYEAFGVRVGRPGIGVGEGIENSHHWYQDYLGNADDPYNDPNMPYDEKWGYWDGGEMDGVSTIGIPSNADEATIKKILKNLQQYAGRADGSQAYLVAGDYAYGGEDPGESVIVNAISLGTIELPEKRWALKNTSDTPVEMERVLEGIDGRPAIRVLNETTVNEAEAADAIMRDTNARRNQTQDVTEYATARRKAHDYAYRVLKDYQSKYSKDMLRDNFDALINELAQNGRSQDTMDEAAKLARAIIEQSEHIDNSAREQYKELRKTLRETKVKLTTTQKQEAENIAGSYGRFRQSVFGTFTLSDEGGKSLDAIWDEWSHAAPNLFPPKMNEGDMVRQLVTVRGYFMPKVSNPYGEDIDGASTDLAMQIHEHLLEALGDREGSQVMRSAVDELRKQYREALDEELLRIRSQRRYAFDQIASSLRQARLTKNPEAAEVAMRAYRNQMTRISAEKAEAEAQLAYRMKYEDRTERAKTWERITKYATDMRNTLAKPNKKKHVPQELQKDLLGVLEGLDFTRNGRVSEGTQAWKDSLTRIDQFMNEQLLRQQNPDGDTRGIWMSVCKPALDLFHANVDVIKNARGPINQMTLNEMKNLSSALAQVNHAINSINEMWTNARHETVDEVAGRTMDELDKVRTNKAQNSIAPIRMLDNMLNIENLDAGSFFQRLGKAATTVYDGLREGQSKAYARIREANEAAKSIFTNSKREIRRWAKEQHDVGVSYGAELRTVKMTGTQLMELYALSRREQGRKHLLTGGFRLDGEGGKLGDTRTYKMTEDQLNAAVSQLSADQKATTERMQDYLSHTVSEWGNEVTEAMYLYRLFGEDYYWPIRSEKGYQRTREQDGTVLFNALTNAGFTKNVQDMVSNPLMIGDAITTFSGHVSDMATFSGLAMPVDDLLRWYNYAARDENGRVAYTTSVKKEIERTTGRGGLTYIQNLLDSLNGMGKSAQESAFATWMMSSYKRAAIMAKLRVVIQQPTAILRASAEINPVYLMEALATVGGHNIQEMQEHSALAWWKGNGNYEIGTGASMKSIITGMQDSAKDDAFELMNKPAGAADDLGWRAIWIAVKRETAARHKDLTVDSDAYWEHVTNRFEEICMKTQVVDTVLTRSAMMRSKSALQKMATAFMSEPTKNYNLMRTAISDFYQAVTSHDATARHRAEGKIMRYGMAIATATALNALVTAAFDALKYYNPEDKDEEGNPVTRLDLMLNNWLGDFTDSMNPLTNIPYVKDVYAVVTGEDVERMDLSTISRLMNAVNRADKYFRQGNPNGYTTWAAVKPLVTGLGDVLGLPVSGLVANTEFALNIIQPGFTRSKARAATVSGAVEELYEAITSGDREKAERLRANMEKGQYGRDPMSEKEISKKLTDMLARSDDRVRQAWEAKQDINGGATYTRLRNALMSDGWTKDEANYAIDHYDDVMIADAKKSLREANEKADAAQAETWRDVLRDYGQTEEQIAKAEAEKDLEEALESPKATYRDLYQMLRAGETAEASDLRGQLRAQGKTPEEISKGVADQLAMNDDRIQALWEKRQKGKATTAADYRPIQADGFTDEEVKQAVNRYPNIVQSEAKEMLLQAQADGDKAAMETYRQRLISVGTKEETINGWLAGKDMDAELEDVAVYKTENLMASIRSAETTAADIQDIRDYLMSKSKAADPMKGIQSSITSAFKDEYIDLVTSGKTKEAERLKKNMLLAGAKEDTIDNWVPAQEKADATDALKAAIDRGDARAVEREVDRIRDEEIMDVSAIVTRLNSAYKQKYFDLLDAGREREADALADMLAGLGLKKKNGENYYSGSWWNEQYRDYLKKKEE